MSWYVAAFSGECRRATGPQICGERDRVVPPRRRHRGGVGGSLLASPLSAVARQDRRRPTAMRLSRCVFRRRREVRRDSGPGNDPGELPPARLSGVANATASIFRVAGRSGAGPTTSLLPDWRLNAASDWATVRGLHHFPANYQLVLDNLLDLTHVQFVHKNLGGPGVAENPLTFSVDGDVVNTFRMMRDVELARHFQGAGQERQIRPLAEANRAGAGLCLFRSRRRARRLEQSAGRAASRRDPGHHAGDRNLDPLFLGDGAAFRRRRRGRFPKKMRAITVDAFDEDVAVLAAQQRSIDADRSGRPLNAFACDAAGLAVRRILARKIAAEKSRPSYSAASARLGGGSSVSICRQSASPAMRIASARTAA